MILRVFQDAFGIVGEDTYVNLTDVKKHKRKNDKPKNDALRKGYSDLLKSEMQTQLKNTKKQLLGTEAEPVKKKIIEEFKNNRTWYDYLKDQLK